MGIASECKTSEWIDTDLSPASLPPARFLLSRNKVLEMYNKLQSVADIVSYSYKTNPEVGSILEKKTDSMFGVHSFNSVKMIDDKSRVWFFAQGWNKKEIDSLVNSGVCSFIVDNANDLYQLIDYMENKDTKTKTFKIKKINLLLRMRLREHTIHTGKYYVYGFYSNEIQKRISELNNKEYIDKLGIHFHRKTQNVGEWNLKEEFSELLGRRTLKMMNYVNIGGGLPAIYKNYRTELIETILKRIKEFREWLNVNGIKMIIEPGRFIAAPSVKLEAYVKNVYSNNVIVNCSVYNSFMDTIVLNLRLLVEDEIENMHSSMPKNSNIYEYVIKGETPDSYDIFRYKVLLPKKIRVGDKIVFLNAGAYNYHTDFCNLPKIETVIVDHF